MIVLLNYIAVSCKLHTYYSHSIKQANNAQTTSFVFKPFSNILLTFFLNKSLITPMCTANESDVMLLRQFVLLTNTIQICPKWFQPIFMYCKSWILNIWIDPNKGKKYSFNLFNNVWNNNIYIFMLEMLCWMNYFNYYCLTSLPP